MEGRADGHERLHKLLRGERAAVESYERALDDVQNDPARELLHAVLEDHRRAVAVLERHIALSGESADRSSGPWGAFARAVETAASWIDDPHTLKALKEGEVHGVSEYRTALSHDDPPPALRRIIEGELLPCQQGHVASLDRLIARLETRDADATLRDRVEGTERARR